MSNGIRPGRIRLALVIALLAAGFTGVASSAGPASAAGVPSAPTNFVATVGHFNFAELHWQRPVSDGGSEIQYYVIRHSPGAPEDGLTSYDNGNEIAAQYLIDFGVTYRFSIAAVNDVGVGAFTDVTAPMTPIPMVSVTTTNTTEGNAGTHAATFTVTVSSPTTQPVTLDYATGRAGAGTSFLPTSGTLTFAPRQITKTFTVPIVGDSVYELNEKVTVRLSNVTNADFRKWTATSAILNDDPMPSLRIGDTSKLEGSSATRANVKVPVTLSFPTGSATRVHWTASNGTARASEDYAATSGTITIVKGKTTGSITIPIIGDAKVEPNETILIDLDSPLGATIADGHAVVTIRNDD
jgi:hypothetical protein